MKIKLILFLLVLPSMLSCSKSDGLDEKQLDVTPVTTPILVKKMTNMTTGSPSTTTSFEYNGNKIVKTTNDKGVSKMYTYTSNLITKVSVTSNSVLSEEILYFYDSNERLSIEKHLIYNGLGDSSIKYLYSYNSDNTIDRKIYTGGIVDQNTLFKVERIKLNDQGQPIKFEVVENNQISKRTEIEYDLGFPIYRDVLGMNKLFNEYYNLTERESKKFNLLSNPITLEEVNTYFNTFDSNKFLAKRSRSFTFKGSLITDTYEYFY